MDWILDLLTIYTYNSWLQLITASLLISTPQHLLGLFQPMSSAACSLATASNSADSSGSRAQILFVQQISRKFPQFPQAQLATAINLSTILLPSVLNSLAEPNCTLAALHTGLLVLSLQAYFQLTGSPPPQMSFYKQFARTEQKTPFPTIPLLLL
jgi:hypothetical protein